MKKLTYEFYCRDNVVAIAAELLGKIIVTNIDNKTTSGRIVETEAYIGITDKASHSFGGKRTNRNEHMYADAGTLYVYICYGMHQMFNIVTNKKEIPDAVLVRAIEPLEGIEHMLKRRSKQIADTTLTKGPGNAGKALGITKLHSGINLMGNKIFIAENNSLDYLSGKTISSSKRIGVESAGVDSNLLYRFYIQGNGYVSGRPVN